MQREREMGEAHHLFRLFRTLHFPLLIPPLNHPPLLPDLTETLESPSSILCEAEPAL